MFYKLKNAYGGGYRAGRCYTPNKPDVAKAAFDLNPYTGLRGWLWGFGFRDGLNGKPSFLSTL